MARPAPGPDAEAPRDYVQFKCLPPGGPLNRWSANLTREHDFPGAKVRDKGHDGRFDHADVRTQAMLYGAGVPNQDVMENASHVGIASVWWEGNPCK